MRLLFLPVLRLSAPMAKVPKEEKASWTAFLRHLKERGLKGVRLFVSDKCLGLVEGLGEFYLEAL